MLIDVVIHIPTKGAHMRISRRVDLNAYLRTLVQLADHGITETMLPPSFYKMHWSERKRYLAHAYDLFMCPRCRNICTPASKHQFRELCQKCGGHTKHRITVVPDDELLDAPQLGASIPE